MLKLAISKIPLLSQLSTQEQSLVLEQLLLREFKKGASILLAEQSGKEIMFVADGAVDVKRSSCDGREVIVSRLGVGEIFGEIAILSGSRRSADVTAAEDCMLLVLSSEAFEHLLLAHASFLRSLLVHLANRVAAASTRISDLALLDVACRVFRILREMSVTTQSGELVLPERPTHKEIAAMAGTSREMVTRVLKRLENDELIWIDDKIVKITGNLPN